MAAARRARRPARWARSPGAPRTRTGCAGSTAGWPVRRPGGCGPRPTRWWWTSATAPPPTTAVELLARLRAVRADVEVVGIEIDRARVASAQPLAGNGLSFAVGGFEVPLPGGRRPVLVRALNVLRQYPEAEVAAAWDAVRARLAPDGLLVDGTCDEIGRRATWVAVGAEGPLSLTLSSRLAGLDRPSDLAERLPKVLIHRNVPGEPVHALFAALDAAWARHAAQGAFGVRQRWLATVSSVRGDGWPVLDGPARWRLGELTVGWRSVAPFT